MSEPRRSGCVWYLQRWEHRKSKSKFRRIRSVAGERKQKTKISKYRPVTVGGIRHRHEEQRGTIMSLLSVLYLSCAIHSQKPFSDLRAFVFNACHRILWFCYRMFFVTTQSVQNLHLILLHAELEKGGFIDHYLHYHIWNVADTQNTFVD